MTWPKKYGGHERSAFERYVMLEEMLAAGAPVSSHWIADRQSGPLLLRFGTEEQRERFLPPITRGVSFYRSEEHTSELQSLMRISYAVFCLKKNTNLITTLTYLYH